MIERSLTPRTAAGRYIVRTYAAFPDVRLREWVLAVEAEAAAAERERVLAAEERLNPDHAVLLRTILAEPQP